MLCNRAYLPPLSASHSGTSSPSLTHLDDFSFAEAPRRFKNPYYKKTLGAGKRNKSLKQILAGERDRVDKVAKEVREADELKRSQGLEVVKEVREVVTCECSRYGEEGEVLMGLDGCRRDGGSSSVSTPPEAILRRDGARGTYPFPCIDLARPDPLSYLRRRPIWIRNQR